MSTLSTPAKSGAAPLTNMRIRRRWYERVDWIALVLLLLVESAIVLWNSFDHSLPCWDTAVHRWDSVMVFSLVRHPHARSVEWLRHLFGVNPLYPPLFYFVSAALKFPMGQFAQTDLASNLIFSAVMFFSLYWIALQVCNNGNTARLAAFLIFLYPIVFWSTHCALLDCAVNAMVALSLATFLWWDAKPAFRRSITLGIVFGLTVLTKQNTLIFLAGPIVIAGLGALLRRDVPRLRQFVLAGLTSVVMILPWLLLAGAQVCKTMATIQAQDLSHGDTHDLLREGINHFIQFVTIDSPLFILSPLFTSCLITALIVSPKFNRNKIYLVASAAGAVILASCFRWQHQCRYIVPIAIPAAILTAELFSNLWSKGRILARLAVCAVAILAGLQFLYVAFCQYPLSLPQALYAASKAICAPYQMDASNVQGISLQPLPEVDWGSRWLLSTIAHGSAGKPTSAMIMPSSDKISVTTLMYLAATMQVPVILRTCRDESVLGDSVTFDTKLAPLMHWYLLKTKDQGRQMNGKQSEIEYQRWCNFVRSSGNYYLAATKPLPDGSMFELYRRCNDD